MNSSLRNITLCCLLSCLIWACDRAPKIDGVWNLTYTIDKEGKKAHSAQKTLFDFEGDSLKIIWIGNQQTGDIEGTYLAEQGFRKKNPWRFTVVSEDSSDFVLSIVSKDSLVLSSSYYPEQIVLKPVSRFIHKPFRRSNLIGKAFKSEAPGISHTLDFIDSTSLVNTLGDYTEVVKWSLVDYKGHQFLNSDSFYLLQSLQHDSNSNIILTNQYTGTNANAYAQMKPKYKREQIYGDWLINEGKPVIFHPSGRQRKMGLSIGDNYINQHSKVIDPFIYPEMGGWKLSNDGQYIYQPDRRTILYKIIDLTDTTLSLKYIINTETVLSEETLDKLSTNFVKKYVRGQLD